MIHDGELPAPDPRSGDGHGLHIVGIGASAGGLTALRAFFAEVPAETGVTFVVVMHLAPDHDSTLAEVLQGSARIPVQRVDDSVRMRPDHVYVIPPDQQLKATDGTLTLSEFDEPRARRVPIDAFFRSLAVSHPDSVAVLLSGLGSDGAVGMSAVKEAGGILAVQDPEEAEYEGMPRSALATGLVDVVLPVRELAAKVIELATSPIPMPLLTVQDGGGADESEILARIFARLEAQSGNDFTGYKRSTILRRIARRIQVTRSRGIHEYLQRLLEDDEEAAALRRDLLIAVTSFFRDPAVFEAIEREVIPALLPDVGGPGELRVWVPGCSTGEEAYSLAILLAERTAALAQRPTVQIFATDLDERSIAYAREGLYPEAIAVDVTEARLRRFFREEGAFWRVREELRETVLFAPHNLLRDPPFSRIDLLSSRNLLIYLDRDLQDRVQDIFAYALTDQGFLLLGSSESLRDDHVGFRTVDARHRIYQRSGPRPASARRLALPGPLRRMGSRAAPVRRRIDPAQVHRDAVDRAAPPSILIDADHRVTHVGASAARYLRFPTGAPSDHALHVVRLELGPPLTAALHRLRRQSGPILTDHIALTLDGEARSVRMWVAPAGDTPEAGALVVFLEGSPVRSDAADFPDPDSRERLGRAERDLMTAREELQELVREADTREQDLQASNEELQSVNEEYRSTLEELETSKEELQSVNEELKISNDELASKVNALARANDDLRHLMEATEIAIVFLDRRLRIKRSTPALTHIFNVVPTDMGRPVTDLTHRLDYPEFEADCEAVLRALAPIEREVAGPEESRYLVRIAPYRTSEDRILGVAVTFTDVSRLRRILEKVAHSEARFRALIASTAEIVWSAHKDGLVTEDSPSWRAFTGQSVEEWTGWGWLDAIHPDDREGVRERWKQAVEGGTDLELEYRIRHAESGEWRTTSVRVVPVRDASGEVVEWVGMNRDVTRRREAEQALVRSMEEVERANAAKSRFLATLSHELRTPLNAIIGYARLLFTGVEGPATDGQKSYLTRISASAWHLVSLIEEILTYSRTEAGMESTRSEEVDVVQVVGTVAAMLEPDASAKGITIKVEAPDELLVTTDGGKVRQVITNLMGNAVKYTESGHIDVRLVGDGDRLELSVSDTGPGIPADRIDDIFEPFVQVGSRPRVDGTGLGLTVCKRLVGLLGGTLEVASDVAAGSTFTVRLPVRRHEPVPSGEEA